MGFSYGCTHLAKQGQLLQMLIFHPCLWMHTGNSGYIQRQGWSWGIWSNHDSYRLWWKFNLPSTSETEKKRNREKGKRHAICTHPLVVELLLEEDGKALQQHSHARGAVQSQNALRAQHGAAGRQHMVLRDPLGGAADQQDVLHTEKNNIINNTFKY